MITELDWLAWGVALEVLLTTDILEEELLDRLAGDDTSINPD